jgi:signal transduction histidine kinase
MQSQIVQVLRHYGRSEAWFRGTALASNIAGTAAIAMMPGFGEAGLVFSSSTQLLAAAALELPTSAIADRFGQARAFAIGLTLKIAVTAAFFGAIAAAIFSLTAVAWSLLALEAVLDALANAFISGAHQASYGRWYADRLKDVAVKERPPLFLAAFQYSFRLRMAIPLAMIAFSTVLVQLAQSVAVGERLLLCLPLPIFALRILVIRTVQRDLGQQIAESRERAPVDLRSTSAAVRELPRMLAKAIQSGTVYFVPYVAVGFASTVSSMLLAGYAYRYLATWAGSEAGGWMGGSALSFLVHLLAIVSGRFVYGRLVTGARVVSVMLGGPVGIAAAAALTWLAFDPQRSSLASCLAITAFGLVATFAAGAVQRAVASTVTSEVVADVQATWFGMAELLVCLGAGLFAAIFVSNGDGQTVVPALLAACTVSGLLAGIVFGFLQLWSPRQASLLDYAGVRHLLVGLALVVGLTALDVLSVSRSLDASEESMRDEVAELLGAGVKDPILQGSFVEVRSRLESFTRAGKIRCATVVIWDQTITNCETASAAVAAWAEWPRRVKDLYFSSQGGSVGTITILFDKVSRLPIIVTRIATYGLIYVLFVGLLVLALNRVLRRLDGEARRVLDALNERGSSNARGAGGLRIREFQVLCAEVGKLIDEVERSARDRAIAQTTQMLAHDLRRPFSRARNAMAILDRSSYEDFETMKAYVSKEVDAAFASAAALLGDLLESATERSVAVAACDPGEIIQTAIAEVAAARKLQDDRIEVDLQRGIEIVAEGPRLARALVNLIDNAAHAAPPDGRIWVRMREKLVGGRRTVVFCVGNTGKTISEADCSRMFKVPFTSGKRGGTGLGLTIVKKIVDAHRGQVWVTSNEGVGTEIFMAFPLEAQGAPLARA